MNSKLIFLTMCAIVAQNVLAMRTSAGLGIPTGPMLDFSILEAYRVVAESQTKKVIQSISTIAQQGYEAKLDGQVENLHPTETCEKKLLAPCIAALDPIFQAILVVDTEASAAVANARITCVLKVKKLVKSVCTAVKLAIGKDSAGSTAEIQVIGDERVSDCVIFNSAIFTAIQNNRHGYKVDSAIDSAESKATPQLESAVSNVFKAIATLASIGTQVEKENVFSAFESTLDLASSKFAADLDIKFGVLKTFFVAFCLIDNEFGITVNFHEIRPITKSASFDYEKAVRQDWPTCKEDKIETGSCDQSEIMNQNGDSQTARETAISEAIKGTQLIFTTMENVLAEIRPKKRHVCKNDDLEMRRAKTTATYSECANFILNAMLTTNPKASSEIRAAMLDSGSQLKKAVAVIYEAISLSRKENLSNLPTKLHALEDTTINAFSAAFNYIYDEILREKLSTKIRHKIEHIQKETLSQVKIKCHAIFEGLRVRRVKVTSETQVESNLGTSSSEAQIEASTAAETMIELLFNAIEILCKAIVKDQVTLTADLSVIRSDSQKAILKIKKVVELIFTDILTCTETSSSDNRMHKDVSRDIHTGKAGTTAAWTMLMDSIFSQIPGNKVASLEKENIVVPPLENGVDFIYLGIAIASECNSEPSTTAVKIQAIEKKTARKLIEVAVDIFAGMSEGQRYDAQVNDTINRNLENTISIAKVGTRNIFSGIKILSTAICSGGEAGGKNYSSEIANFSKKAAMYCIEYTNQIFDSTDLLFSKVEPPKGSCSVTVP